MSDYQPPNGWLLYDGSCGACTHFIGDNEKFFLGYGFAVAPIQEHNFRQKINATEEEIAREIFLLKSDGSVFKGPDVYREIFRTIRWLKPVFLLSNLPILSSIFNFSYRKFAANRHRISAVCGFEPRL